MKRAWALSHAWDWWRADCSRRLVMGSLRRAGLPGAERDETSAGAPPARTVGLPAPAELAGLGVLVPFPASEAPTADAQTLDQPLL